MRPFRLYLLALACALAYAVPATGADVRTFVPGQAYMLLPQLRSIQLDSWPDAPIPSFLAAQIEQESCISLTHSKCWNTRAELKTKREYGFGLGQTTTAYRADGTVRFDKQAELRQQYVSLRGWTWDNRYDARYQLLALVEMDHGIYRRVSGAASDVDRLAFTLSAYNGGESGLRQDRLLCLNAGGCDNRVWFGHVERFSLKAKKPNPGYGESAFDINRGYVNKVLNVRRQKYERFFGGIE